MEIKDAVAKIEEIKTYCSWIRSYGWVSSLIEEINAKQIIEIGVAYGFHCEHILKNNNIVNYIGIDPYKGEYDSNDCFAEDVKKFFSKSSQQEALDILYEAVKNKMSIYGDRFKLLRNNVENLDKEIENDSIDLIYVDGDHTYDGVMRDLIFSWKKVNKNHGILCGDDFGQSRVKKACDDFFNGKNIKYDIASNGNWIYRF